MRRRVEARVAMRVRAVGRNRRRCAAAVWIATRVRALPARVARTLRALTELLTPAPLQLVAATTRARKNAPAPAVRATSAAARRAAKMPAALLTTPTRASFGRASAIVWDFHFGARASLGS
jgi:hypothetical protein